MSAVLEAREPSAKYLSALQPLLVQQFDLLATAPGGVTKLRELILTLAVQGKLVPQDPNDEPASELLKKIRAEKDRLTAEGKIKRDKPLLPIEEEGQPFNLPRGWQWVRLGTLLPFRIGKTPPSKDPQYWSDDGYAWVSISDMTHFGEVFDTTRKITAKGAGVFGYEPLPVGTLIMSFKLTIGKIATLQVPAYHNEAIVSFLPLAGLQPQFLKYVLPTVSKTGASKDALMGATLNTESLANLLIALPPEAEQPRIATRVEELMRLCDALETKGQLEAEQHAQLMQSLLGALTASTLPEELADNWQRVATHFDRLLDRPEAIDALEQTILQLAVRGLLVPQDPEDEPAAKLLERIQASRKIKRRLVAPDQDLIESTEVQLPSGWTWASVDQLSADTEYAITDGPFGANLKTDHYIASKGYRVVRLQNIGYGTFREEHHAYIDKERFESLQKHQVFAGDLLVAGLVEESIRCCRVPESLGPAIVKADCYRFSVHKAINAGFVDLYLGSSLAHKFAAVHHHGLTLTRIGLGNFRSIPVPIPPYKEQVRIVARVEILRRLCIDLRQHLAVRQTTQDHLAEALIDEVA